MADSTQSSWNDWIGANVVDDSGTKIGTLDTVYMDRESGQPEWLLVKTGLLGTKSSFVPIAGCGADGDTLRVSYSKATVKDAPNVEEDGELSSEEEQRLYQHYGRDDYQASSGDEAETGQAARSGGNDDAMTRSEEELAVGTRSKEAGRVRLRKYVVTENVTTTVPVRKEKVRLEREPITDANRDDATDGADISEAEHEIVLNEEEVVTDKRVVAKERVRLDKDVETEQREVTDEVRKEKIEVDGADDEKR